MTFDQAFDLLLGDAVAHRRQAEDVRTHAAQRGHDLGLVGVNLGGSAHQQPPTTRSVQRRLPG